MRRIILASLALTAAVAVLDIPSAQAQVSTPRNPWCARDSAGGPGSWDCSYQTLNQCRDSISGVGGSCSRNPNYRGGRPNVRRQQYEEGGTWGWGGGRW